MKTVLTITLLSVLLAGCIYVGKSANISLHQEPNLSIVVYTMENGERKCVPNAEIYLDGKLIGNTVVAPVAPTKIYNVTCGERVVRVTASGYKPYEKTITILGSPNAQHLDVCLEKQ